MPKKLQSWPYVFFPKVAVFSFKAPKKAFSASSMLGFVDATYLPEVSHLPNVFLCVSVCDLSEKEQAALPHCSHHKLLGTLYIAGSPAGRLHPLHETQVGESLRREDFWSAYRVELSDMCISHTAGHVQYKTDLCTGRSAGFWNGRGGHLRNIKCTVFSLSPNPAEDFNCSELAFFRSQET